MDGVLRRVSSSLASAVTSHKLLLYTLVSVVTVVSAILKALQSYNNFYSIVVFLSKSSRSVVILANFTALTSFIIGKIVQYVFFGPLRPAEIERLYDRLWFFVTESLLTFTIFRDDFDIPFGLMFGFLLFIKSFHWLASDRIEWMEQRPYPGPSLLFHIRMNALFFLLGFTDMIMFLIAIQSTLSRGVGGMVLFASEYAVLLASIGNTVAKYLLTAYELRRAGRRGGELAPPWEAKSMWIFYLELVTDFLKLSTYLLFFTVIVSYYGFPLSIIRDIYMTARSFINRLRALHRYQNATRNMDEKYPSATEEDMPGDKTCIICREEMVLSDPDSQTQAQGPNVTPKKLPCGHIFHFYCLRSWLERQQSCPTCRRSVLDVPPPATGAQAPGQPGVQDRAAGPAPRDGVVPAVHPAGFAGHPVPAQGQPAAPEGAGQHAVSPGHPTSAGTQSTPEVVIQYRIFYGSNSRSNSSTQIPTSRGPRPENSAPRPLRLPPRLAGFQDPTGAFIPWNVPGSSNATAPAAAESRDTAPSDGAAKRDGVAKPDGDVKLDGEAKLEGDAPPTEAAVDPREAARLAALRRHGAAPPTPSQANPGVSSSDPVSAGSTKEKEPVKAQPPVEEVLPPRIPSLIPLYELFGPNIRLDTQDAASVLPTPTPTPSRTIPPVSSPSANSTRSPTQPFSGLSSSTRRDELFARDQLTRDAIDERLKALDNVSGALTRCIDELMLLRNALPSSQSFPPHERDASNGDGWTHMSSGSAAGVSESGREAAVGHAATPPSPPQVNGEASQG